MTNDQTVTQAECCTCAEVYGEDPGCALHGVETEWALAHTTSEEWRDQVVEARSIVADLEAKIARTAHSGEGRSNGAGECEIVARVLWERLRDRMRGRNGGRSMPLWDTATADEHAPYLADADAILASLSTHTAAPLGEETLRADIAEPVRRIIEKIADAVTTMQRECRTALEMGDEIAKECIPLFEKIGMSNEGDGWGFDEGEFA